MGTHLFAHKLLERGQIAFYDKIFKQLFINGKHIHFYQTKLLVIWTILFRSEINIFRIKKRSKSNGSLVREVFVMFSTSKFNPYVALKIRSRI